MTRMSRCSSTMLRLSTAALLPTDLAFTQPNVKPSTSADSVQKGHRGPRTRCRCEWARWRAGCHKRRLKIALLTDLSGVTSCLFRAYSSASVNMTEVKVQSHYPHREIYRRWLKTKISAYASQNRPNNVPRVTPVTYGVLVICTSCLVYFYVFDFLLIGFVVVYCVFHFVLLLLVSLTTIFIMHFCCLIAIKYR